MIMGIVSGCSLYAHRQRVDDLVAKRPYGIISLDWSWGYSLFTLGSASS